MRVVLLIAALALAGCADADPPGPTLDGTDPVQSDGDLAPDADLAPTPDVAPEPDVAPDPGLAPEATLQPDSSEAP
ncbi:hypothetical protein [Rubrivirga sp.]|uniref:hypothetical protein n=1 Tax=Rubrivirga sp. TaxID=1885344 RepID=UPI003B516B03